MASAVAWADWVMSSCRVGSEAMSQMVRSEKQGGGHKNAMYLKNCWSNWADFHTAPSWGCLLHYGAMAMVSRSWLHHNRVPMTMWCHRSGKYTHFHTQYYCLELTNDKERYSVLCFQCGSFVVCMNVQLIPPLMKEKLSLYDKQFLQKPEFISHHCYHDL